MKRWMRVSLLIVGTMLGLWNGPPAAANMVQGGEVGEGTNKNIKTFTVDFNASGNAAGGGMNNISAFPADTYIIGFKIIATDANSNFDLYDATTAAGGRTAVQSVVIDELAEVSANGTAVQIWPHPYKIKTGLSVGGRNCTGIIYFY